MVYFNMDEKREQINDAIEAEQKLPDGFWNVPSTFIEDESIRGMYSILYQSLLDENPDRDVIETMMIERAAALYCYMRMMEKMDGYRNTTDYRQLTTLWNNMANDLRTTRKTNFDESKIREEISLEYAKLVNDALRGMDPTIASTVRQRVKVALERGA